MVEKLRNRYGAKGLEARYKNELRCRRHRKDETLRELSQDINRLMALAFPGEQSAITDHLAQEAFIQALDSDLAYQVLTREPKNLDDACRKAQQVEVSRQGIQAAAEAREGLMLVAKLEMSRRLKMPRGRRLIGRMMN